jgi:hypothetical protein
MDTRGPRRYAGLMSAPCCRSVFLVAAVAGLSACGVSASPSRSDASLPADAASGPADAALGADATVIPPGADSGAADAAVLPDAAVDGGLLPDAGSDDSGIWPDAAAPDTGIFTPNPHPPFPKLMDQGSGVLTSMKLVTVVASNDALAQSEIAFDRALLLSHWWPTVSREYGVTSSTMAFDVIGPPITSDPTGTQMEAYIRSAIHGHPELQPDGNTVYMLYLPENVVALNDSLTPPQPNTRCQFFGGYHTSFGNGPDNWGVAQHCTPGLSADAALAEMTLTSSHEIVESATDPEFGYSITTSDPEQWTASVWGAAQPGAVEDADLCTGTQIQEGQYWYQRIWSNAAALAGGDPCVPPLSGPYYSVSTPEGWYPMSPGETIHIAVSGWSTAPLGNWAIDVSLDNGTNAVFSTTLTASVTSPSGHPVINNGGSATLTVTAPANGQSQSDWSVFEIDSFGDHVGADQYHFWNVGVYIR